MIERSGCRNTPTWMPWILRKVFSEPKSRKNGKKSLEWKFWTCIKPPGVKGGLGDGTEEKHYLWGSDVMTGKIIPFLSFVLRSSLAVRSVLEEAVARGNASTAKCPWDPAREHSSSARAPAGDRLVKITWISVIFAIFWKVGCWICVNLCLLPAVTSNYLHFSSLPSCATHLDGG